MPYDKVKVYAEAGEAESEFMKLTVMPRPLFKRAGIFINCKAPPPVRVFFSFYD
jgi:hypothetical protein